MDDSLDLTPEIQEQLDKLYAKVGFIINLSQMIEYTLANVLAFDEILRAFDNRDSMFVYEYNEFAAKANKWYEKLSKKEFGYSLKRAAQIEFFDEKSLEELMRISKERNYVVHHLFRDDIKENMIIQNPASFFERLEALIGDMYQANNCLNAIFKAQKDEFKLIW